MSFSESRDFEKVVVDPLNQRKLGNINPKSNSVVNLWSQTDVCHRYFVPHTVRAGVIFQNQLQVSKSVGNGFFCKFSTGQTICIQCAQQCHVLQWLDPGSDAVGDDANFRSRQRIGWKERSGFGKSLIQVLDDG